MSWRYFQGIFISQFDTELILNSVVDTEPAAGAYSAPPAKRFFNGGGNPAPATAMIILLDIDHGSEARKVVAALEAVTPLPKPKKKRT